MSGGTLTLPHMPSYCAQRHQSCDIGDHDEYCHVDRWTDIQVDRVQAIISGSITVSHRRSTLN